MSTVITTTVKTEPTTDTLTIGAAGDSVAISGDSLNLNTLQDAGGNTTFVSDGSGTITSSNFPGALKLVSTQTASGASSISFTSGLDSTYDVYCFKFINLNPVTQDTNFTFNVSTDGGSTYNITKTTSFYRAYHSEAGAGGNLEYEASMDLSMSTDYQILAPYCGNGADESTSGEFYLFTPSNTTYVKNYYSRVQVYQTNPQYSQDIYTGGAFDTTSAINAIDFKMASGNFDGVIQLYGISKS